jgi:DNA-binding NtrC family response regulator
MKPLSILVADDEESIRHLMLEWLKRIGHTVTVVTNAIEGRAELARKNYDVVITDVLMPDGDGLNLITAIKQSHPDIRIVAMSGGGRYLQGEDYLKMARGLGAHAIVSKPFTLEEITAGIEQAVAPPPKQP